MKTISSVLLLFGIMVGLAACGRQLMGDDWPQWRGPTRDGVWKETGLVEKFSGPAASRPLAGRPSAADIAARPWPKAASTSPTGRPTPPGGKGPLLRLENGPQPVELHLRLRLQRRGLHGGAAGLRLHRRWPGVCLGDHGASALPRCRYGQAALEEGTGRGLQSPRADLGHRRGAAGRRRVGDRPTRRRGGMPGGLGQEDRAPSAGGPWTIGRPIRPRSSSSRPAGACSSAGRARTWWA